MTLALVNDPARRSLFSTPDLDARFFELLSHCKSLKDTNTVPSLVGLGRLALKDCEIPDVMTSEEHDIFFKVMEEESCDSLEGVPCVALMATIFRLLETQRYAIISDIFAGTALQEIPSILQEELSQPLPVA